jgi:hypothetical protein
MNDENILYEHQIDFHDLKKSLIVGFLLMFFCCLLTIEFRFISFILFAFLLSFNMFFFFLAIKSKIIMTDDKIYFKVVFFNSFRVYEMAYIDIRGYQVGTFDKLLIYSKYNNQNFHCYCAKNVRENIIKILREKTNFIL